jgi:FecR-like protein
VIAALGSSRISANIYKVFILFALALACTARSAGAQVTPVDARIASVSGTALLSSGTQAPIAAKRGDVLAPGEEIDTRGGGHLTIELTDGSLVVVRPGSRVLLRDFREASTLRELFEVLLGRVRVRINHFGGKPNPYRINSPTASIAVRGTEFSVAVNGVGDTEVIVYEGLVEVTSLSNPQNGVLVHPGQGVIVRPNQDIHFFASSPDGEIGGFGGSQETGGNNQDRTSGSGSDPQDSENANSPRNSAGIYDRFVESVINARQGPLFLRFTAYPDSFLDGLENPAYATEFSAPEGRVFLLPSFRGSQGVGATQSDFRPNQGQSLDYSLSPQGSFFTPLPDHRTAIGGGVAAFRSGIQSFTLDDAASLSSSLFPPGTTGARAASDSTNTSFLSGAFAVAHALGEEKRTSVGLGLDYVKGWGSLLNFVTQQDAAGNVASERIDSHSNLAQTRIKAGVSQEFSGERKLGIYYSYGFVSAGFGNVSHTLNGQPQSLDTTQSAGRSSEVGIRFRGVLTKKLFYGAQASWFLLSLDDQLKLSAIVNSHEHDRTAGSTFAVGLGYAIRPRIVFSLDLAGGFSNTTTTRTEDATGNLLQRNCRSSPFFSAHEAVQADVWRHLFVSASLLTVRQTLSTNLALYPDRFGRLLTSDGTFAPSGLTRDRTTTYYSEFGAGWRFSDSFLAEYVFATDYGVTQPSHVFLLRYNFRVREH